MVRIILKTGRSKSCGLRWNHCAVGSEGWYYDLRRNSWDKRSAEGSWSRRRTVIDMLLARGLDINACYGPKGATVLHHAVASQSTRRVQHLILRGASTAARDMD